APCTASQRNGLLIRNPSSAILLTRLAALLAPGELLGTFQLAAATRRASCGRLGVMVRIPPVSPTRCERNRLIPVVLHLECVRSFGGRVPQLSHHACPHWSRRVAEESSLYGGFPEPRSTLSGPRGLGIPAVLPH